MAHNSTPRIALTRFVNVVMATFGPVVWVVVPFAVLGLGVLLRDIGATKGQSLVAEYVSLLALTMLAVKALSVIDWAYRARHDVRPSGRTRPSPAEVVVALCALLAVIAIVVWLLVGDTCATGLYVCG